MGKHKPLVAGILILAALELLPRGILAQPPGAAWVGGYAVSLLFTAVLWLGNVWLWRRGVARWPLAPATARRLWWQAAASLAYTLLATVVLGAGLAWALRWPYAPGRVLPETGLNLVSTLVVLLIYEARHTFGQWQVNLRRADQLTQAQTQAQLDALTQQLDPHFLFNSLNTLAALIEPTNAAAQQYLEGLADLYRYVLLSRERPTVPLADELVLVKTYVALQQVRFGAKVHVTYDLAPAALARRVAPLSVQTLLENALKHNEASQARPLHVQVRATPDALTVANTYQPRLAGLAPGLGTGLASVRRRYALLGAPGPVVVAQAAGEFTVTLPLLPGEEEF
ncbi:MAG TPA: sensor histidine kinase [Hymenobacter sp.]|uniref:sensor histidine kinase n=1 Tax=Hymenobacter sp. TaxID=1898978 RepID=UPI002D80E62D|nr:sensor histidine kinase [Hymenobacter sp.]HET9502291.1 sensor histidine kinase [Hymenobacter sp.]